MISPTAPTRCPLLCRTSPGTEAAAPTPLMPTCVRHNAKDLSEPMEQEKLAPTDENWLAGKSQVMEVPFHSDLPIAGGLISRFREAWNNVAAKWYVRPMLAQQNEFNRLVVRYLQDLDARLIAQDREQTAAVHDMAEISVRITQMNHLLESIDQRLEKLEAGSSE